MPSIFQLEGPQLSQLPNGGSAGLGPEAFDPTQLAIGTRVEMEHTKDPRLAQRIAMDHLVEDPAYYQKLKLVHLDGALGSKWWKVALGALGLVGVVAGALALRKRYGSLRGSWEEDFARREIERIAKTSSDVKSYARRVEAWTATEANPPSIALLAKAWGTTPAKLKPLLTSAKRARLAERGERMSTYKQGLRGIELVGREPKKVPIPLPFERKPQVPSRWHDDYIKERVPLDRMIATQREVTARGVRQYKSKTPQHDIDLPVVYRTDDGRLYIADGHHRIVAALRRGDRDIKARVIDIGDPDKPRKPLGDVEGRAPAQWWRNRRPEQKVCYTTKSDALVAFLDANQDIVQNYGGVDYKVSPSEFDAINHKYNLRGKQAARSIADAVWAAMPEQRPYCLDQIDVDALNDTSPAREAGTAFRLPDHVYESSMADEEARYYASLGRRRLGAISVTAKQQRMFKRGIEAMRRAMQGSPGDFDHAFNVAIRGSKDPDFATGVRTVWNLASGKGDREAAQGNLVKYGFKSR